VDGFFVAKFKVMKKTKKTEAARADVQDQDDAMDVTLGEEEDVLANATFNDDEDEAIIKGTREVYRSVMRGRLVADRRVPFTDSKRRALKNKGVKFSKGKGDKVVEEPVKASKLKNKPRPLPESTKKTGRKA
jgi:hypothetical protein